jgi:2-(1,2-epoxy-1,2-dihydrophenyl)acetyl-CoA isomerase
VRLGEVIKRKYNPIVQRIRRMDKPVLGAVNGTTAGAGLGLALACDLRVASDKATFHEAFIKAGLVPDSGTSFWLTRILGLGKAMEVSLLGEPIDAAKALNLGLVNWVFPDEIFRAEAEKIAERLARGPTRAMGLTKRALNRAVVVDIDSALEYEMYLQDIAGRTKDHVEGVKAFFDKRDPSFTGQ